MKDGKILAVIPARKGSKGLPGKNIKVCAGKPLIAWTIEAALKSLLIDKLAVSTNCEDIAKISHEYGADVPFLRPDELSQDDTPIEDVLKHAVSFYSKLGESFDYILLLQPTSPLRSTLNINESIEIYFKNKTNVGETLVSVYKLPRKLGWIMSEKQNGYIDFALFSRDLPRNRQQLPMHYYMPNGAIYLAKISEFGDSFYTDKTRCYIMNIADSVDVDEEEDFKLAEKMLNDRRGKNL
jgi:CMP-N,N'-diacetyllegionaminic acid synthase